MKKVIIAVAALAVIVVGLVVFVWSNLDSIVKQSIETYGSQATKTQVSVSRVKIKLESGEAAIGGLSVGNPSGFTDPNIFELGEISTRIDISTIRENPIVIDEVIINGPAVVYEINKSGLSNVDVLKKNLGGADSSAGGSIDGESVKIIIRKLVIESGKAKVRIAALGNAEQTVNLPRIELTDIGKKSGGATATELATILSSKLLGNVKGSVAKLGLDKYLGKSADALKKAAADALNKAALEKVDNIGGALGGEAGKAVKGLFGK